ncbi:hypothetical protein NPIL_577891 [Nephila pilipes]|uniref:Uncharacterized protein n=1 Tax=Nephila pilipes TaxID=299642 RepID=A0A8X6P6E6_NEPPI|nr:hypothetical protein NPIL_577891 [Nephila pilipes]
MWWILKLCTEIKGTARLKVKNRAFHEGIKCTAYEAMFGMPLKESLKIHLLSRMTLKYLRTEELQALVETVSNVSDDTNSEIEDDSNVKNNDPSLNDSTPAINL